MTNKTTPTKEVNTDSIENIELSSEIKTVEKTPAKPRTRTRVVKTEVEEVEAVEVQIKEIKAEIGRAHV